MNPTDQDEAARRRQAQQTLSSLARGMGHDFNNLFQGVVGALSVVKLTVGPTSELSGILDLAERSAAQARDLGQRLVLLAKGSGNLEQMGPLDALIPATVKGTLKGAPVVCRFELPPGLPPVRYDEGHLQHLIGILTSNAMEAMDGKGCLDVQAGVCAVGGGEGLPLAPGTYLRCAFRDHGRGLSAEDLARVFDPTFTTKQGGKQKGAGFSLAIAQAIAQLHGGAVTAASTPGDGATFAFYLPVQPA